MILTKESQNSKLYLHLNGSHHIMVPDGEEDIFRAYLELAYNHSINDAEMYENAESNSLVHDSKKIFSQMACRKRETAQLLKMNRSETSIPCSGSSNFGKGTLTRYVINSFTSLPVTLEGAYDFIAKREYKTLLLYKKILKSTTHSSINVLFDFLIESQHRHIAYVSAEIPLKCRPCDFLEMVA